MANFFTPPFKLRQQILTYAFEDTALQDLYLSKSQSDFGGSLQVESASNLGYLELVMPTCTTNIYDLAVKFARLNPQLHSDMAYPMSRILARFECLDDGRRHTPLLRMWMKRYCLASRFKFSTPWILKSTPELWSLHMSKEQISRWIRRIDDAQMKIFLNRGR
jgi:hypothetical protein